jgi:RsiW-degrading membrane proteinase PrsW (M82 family)
VESAAVGIDAPAADTELDPLNVRWRHPGVDIFLLGLALWSVAAFVAAVTGDPILVPMVILAGSFVIPVAVVVGLFHRQVTQVGTAFPTGIILGAFLGGGTVGVLLSALLETYLLPSRTGTFIVVGLVEEACKGLVIVLVARYMRSRAPLDGMVLGAIVGAGFAAFESAGYAFDSYVYGSKDPLQNVLQTQINRAPGEPFSHIVWSSILGGALFLGAAGHRRLRLTKGVFASFVGVVALHALWDQANGWAIIMTRAITGSGWHLGWPDSAAWKDSPTSNQLEWHNVVYQMLVILIGLAGALWFVQRWLRFRPRPAVATTRPQPQGA